MIYFTQEMNYGIFYLIYIQFLAQSIINLLIRVEIIKQIVIFSV